MKLSEISCDPKNNQWRTALIGFFQGVHGQPAYPPLNVAGTPGYIQSFAYDTDIPNAVFFIANFTVAAYMLTQRIRISGTYLISYLASTQDDQTGNVLPILAFGTATWAAETESLDNTPVLPYPSGSPAAIWVGMKLKGLPAFLQSQRSPDSLYPSGGNFYWRFDHQWGCGYTEDDIFGLMGLVSSQKRVSTLNFNSDVQAVRSHLLNAIDDSGAVWDYVDWDIVPCPVQGASDNYSYIAGELLMALQAAAIPGDLDLNDSVDSLDLAYYASRWLHSGGPCVGSDNIADLNQDGNINFADFAIMCTLGSHY